MNSNVNETKSVDQTVTSVEGIDLNQKFTTTQYLKFILPSIAGIFIFLTPIIVDGSLNIPLGVLSNIAANLISSFANLLIFSVVVISAIGALITLLFKPKFITEGKILKSCFVTTPIYTCLRVVGAVIATMVYFQIGPEAVWSGATGGTMMSLMGTLISWWFVAAFLMPLLTEYGIMDFVGTLIRGLLKPLFKLPGRAAIDLCASWIGNNNVGVVLTVQQYEKGYYTGREAVTIATCFSCVSLPFCLVIAETIGVTEYFVPMYLILTVTGFLSVIIMTRIWPLNKKYTDNYIAGMGKQIQEEEPHGVSKVKWATFAAVTKAKSGPNVVGVFATGWSTIMGIIWAVIPITICIGTIGLILSEYTPIFTWISLPFGYYLDVLGVEYAFEAAPGVVVGFADMFLPALISSGIESTETRFIIAIISLVQIIYISEVGVYMISSKLPVNILDLAIIFLEKTIISIPIIVLLTKLFVNFS